MIFAAATDEKAYRETKGKKSRLKNKPSLMFRQEVILKTVE